MRSLERGLTVLNVMKDAARPLSLHDLFLATGISKPSLLRIIKALSDYNLVRRGIEDSLYRLSVRLDTKPLLSAKHEATATAAAPVMDRLSETIKWPTELIVRRDDHMEILESTRVRSPFHLSRMYIGKDVDLVFSGAGRAYLAFAGEDEAQEIIAKLGRTGAPQVRKYIRSGDVYEMIARTRAAGYGERDATMAALGRTDPDGTWGIAIPLVSRTAIYGCISLIWVQRAATVAQIVGSFLPTLRSAAGEIVRDIER